MPSFVEQSNGPSVVRRVLFVALAIVALVLATLYTQEGESGPLHGVQTNVMGVTGGAAGVTSGVGAATQTLGTALGDATADPTTLEGLRQQNEELRQMLAQAEEYRQEVDRLRGLLDIKQVSGVTGPVARVIGHSTNAWDQSITIDLGSDDGVVSGMTVMGATGVIGQVSKSAAHTSTVRLLTDPNSGAAVMVQSSRANGIVRGSLSGLLYLEDVDEDKLPVAGDVIITSGMGGSYERGLIVGAVASVGDTSSGNAGPIVINPNATVKMLEEVIVVFKAPQVSDTATSSSAASAQKTQEDQANAQGNQDQVDVTAQTADEGDESYAVDGSSDEGEWQDEEAADEGEYLEDQDVAEETEY